MLVCHPMWAGIEQQGSIAVRLTEGTVHRRRYTVWQELAVRSKTQACLSLGRFNLIPSPVSSTFYLEKRHSDTQSRPVLFIMLPGGSDMSADNARSRH